MTKEWINTVEFTNLRNRMKKIESGIKNKTLIDIQFTLFRYKKCTRIEDLKVISLNG